MKKEKKMRKRIVGFIIAGILVLAFGFVSTPARAELSLGVVGGYYSPNFGQVNDDLDDRLNTPWGTDLEFKAGTMYGLALGYDLPPRFGLRLEYNSFESKTSDTYSETVLFFEERLDADFKVTVTPLTLFLIYRFSPAYIGAGVGLFDTKLEYTITYEEYLFDVLVFSDVETDKESDSPTGFVLLAGYGFGGDSPFLNLEARYVVGTKAKLEDLDTEVDLSGLQLCLLGGFRF